MTLLQSQDASLATAGIQAKGIRVKDEWLSAIPDDLYIPPEAFEILLEYFEGPLDFLLYLVNKNGLDLRALDIAPIASQYLQYIHKMKALDIELAGDYLVMAALLADLKSRLLLPKPETALIAEDDPRKQLIERLEAYAKIKKGAAWLQQRNVLERDVFPAATSLPDSYGMPKDEIYDVLLLEKALMALLSRPRIVPHQIEHESIQLEDRMDAVRLATRGRRQLSFVELLNPYQGRMGIVVTFMAILELVRQGQILIVSASIDEPLAIQGNHDEHA